MKTIYNMTIYIRAFIIVDFLPFFIKAMTPIHWGETNSN